MQENNKIIESLSSLYDSLTSEQIECIVRILLNKPTIFNVTFGDTESGISHTIRSENTKLIRCSFDYI